MKDVTQDHNLKNVSAYSVYNGLAAGFRSYVDTSEETTASKRRKAKKRNLNENADLKKDVSALQVEEETSSKPSRRQRKNASRKLNVNSPPKVNGLESAPNSKVNTLENFKSTKPSVTKLKSKSQTASLSNGSALTSSPLVAAAKSTENDSKKKRRKKRKDKKKDNQTGNNQEDQTLNGSPLRNDDEPPTKSKKLSLSGVGATGNLVPNPIHGKKQPAITVIPQGKLKVASNRPLIEPKSAINQGRKVSNKTLPRAEKTTKKMEAGSRGEKFSFPATRTGKELVKIGRFEKPSDRGQPSTSKSVKIRCKDSSYKVISRVPAPEVKTLFNRNRVDDSVDHGKRTLEWLIHPVPSSEFMENYWEKKPLLIKRQHDDADEYYKWILTTQSFDDVLRRNVVKYTVNLDITSYTNGIRETPSENLQGRVRPAVVWDYYNNGCSLRMLNPQSFVKQLWRVNSYLQEWFGSFVGANLYLTPPDSQGFAPHYDDIDAFILQVEGKKQWKLYAPRFEDEQLPRFSSRNFSEETDSLGEPILDVILEEGDLLYFPRGVIHQAKTVDGEHSMHLTLSCHQLNTYGDLLKHHVNHALDKLMAEDISFRQGLPTDYLSFMGIAHRDNTQDRSLVKKRKEFGKKLEELVTKLAKEPADHAADAMGKKFIWDSLPPYLTPRERETCVVEDGEFVQNGEVFNRVEFGPETEVKFIRKNCVRLMAEDGLLKLYYSSENSMVYHEEDAQFLELSVELSPAVNYLINEYPNFTKIEDLPHSSESVGELEKTQMISDLWERGILMTKEPLEPCRFDDDGSAELSDKGDGEEDDEEDVESIVLSDLENEDDDDEDMSGDDDFYDTSEFDDNEGSDDDSDAEGDSDFEIDGQGDSSSMESDSDVIHSLYEANHDQDDRDGYELSDSEAEEMSEEEDSEMGSEDDDDDDE